MWSSDEIAIEISSVDGDVMLVAVSTPAETFELIGAVSIRAGILVIENAHIQGLAPGALGRHGLNAIARKMMVETDVQGLVVEGGTRTTGRTRGRRQRPFRFPHPASPDADG
ncbi:MULTISPECIES: hypothetical protein [unclassified Methylobacterium]|uniref:hypothetical protein n=1 Tax=unclassified Methylobacterium TaxID=2615210 RepID=UPI0036FFD019